MDKSRLGTFLLLVGFVMLILFFGTDQSLNPQYILFFGGTPLTALGIYWIWSNRKPPQPTTRFASLRRMMNPSKEPAKPKDGAAAPKKDAKKGFFRFRKK